MRKKAARYWPQVSLTVGVMVEFRSTLNLSAVLAFSVLAFDVAATPPADEPSRAKAREDAEFLEVCLTVDWLAAAAL